jgi:hypothetical protein
VSRRPLAGGLVVLTLVVVTKACAEEAPPPPPPAVPAQVLDPSIAAVQPVAPTRLAKTPVPLAADPAWDEVVALLEPTVRRYTDDPDNPWAICHGLLVYGDALTVEGGANAVDWLYAHYARRDARGLVTFPESVGNIRVEPHPDLVLKSITESAVDPARTVTVEGEAATVADHYRGTLDHTDFNATAGKTSYTTANEMPWAVQAMSAWAPGLVLSWRSP